MLSGSECNVAAVPGRAVHWERDHAVRIRRSSPVSDDPRKIRISD